MTKTSRTCCFCLSSRVGVLMIATTMLIIGSTFLITGVVMANKFADKVSPFERLALYVHVFVYLCLASFSIPGLLGAITKRRKQVSFFFSMLIAHIPVGIGSGIYFLYKLFHLEPSEGADTCIWAANGKLSKDRCEQGLAVVKGFSVALFIIVWLIEIYGCFVVNSYAAELREQDEKAEELNPYA